MFDLTFLEWKEELGRIVDDTYGITVSEFCESKLLPKYYKLQFSPVDAFEELDELYNSH